MPLELSVWRIDNQLQRVAPWAMDLESRLEDLLASDISIASTDWMVIGRQLRTPWNKKIDLLCIDRDGDLVVLELKRRSTEREIVAQTLDYGSYVRTIGADEVPRIFHEYQKERLGLETARSLDQAFCEHFGVRSLPDELNGSHELVIVASVLDSATERIVNYLRDEFEVEINAVFFQVFRDGDREYLTRAWLRDPSEIASEETPERAAKESDKVEWNGEYYVNFGEGPHRSWNDAVRYGFVSAGCGPRLRDAMARLRPGNRIWVNVPGTGYVGVGIVRAEASPVSEFALRQNGATTNLLDLPLSCERMGQFVGDADREEYVVPVEWIKTVPLDHAVREHGFFGNQNCVVQPRDPKWLFTIERLKTHFGIPAGSKPPDA